MGTEERKMNDKEIRDVLKDLSSKSGGSLVKRIKRHRLNEDSEVLFIGLGGLGSLTVNEIKGIYKREFENSDKIDFLAVDTDVDAQSDLKIGTATGNLEADELFQIYDISAKNLLSSPPQEVKNWLGNIAPTEIHQDGAQGVRQVGRIMLCGTNKYIGLQQIIKNKINSLMNLTAANHILQVIIVSGISGGTGSGTFIDVSYMVQQCLSTYSQQSNMWGVFFTPDVQKNEPGILGNASTWNRLQKNGYAAFKELDYFVSSGSQSVNAPIIYKLKTPLLPNAITSSRPLFDRGKVFVVSSRDEHDRAADIIDSAAKSILNMFRTVNSKNGDISILSAYSNFGTDLSQWDTDNIGKPNEGKEPDPLGIRNTEFPSFMNYNYTSFGYSSLYFPRDEMLSYCANVVMTKLYDEWNKKEYISQQFVDKVFKKFINDKSNILNTIKSGVGKNESALRISETNDAGSWPVVHTVFGVGRVSGLDQTVACATRKVDDALISVSSDSKGKSIVNDIAKGMSDPIIKFLSDYRFVEQYGPFAAIVVIMGLPESGILGLTDKLINLVNNSKNDIQELQNKKDLAEKAMLSEKTRLEGDVTPSADEINLFIEKCFAYSKALYNYRVYNDLFNGVLQKVFNDLKNFNNETYDIYVPIIDNLVKILKNDADIIAEGRQDINVQGNVVVKKFGMDALGFTTSESKRNRFISMFDGYVNEERTSFLAKAFASSMFSPDNKERWKTIKDDPDWLIEEIRRLFNKFFDPFVNDMLEKFIVLAYGSDLKNMTIEKLDTIWDAPDGTEEAGIRDLAIADAAKEIVSEFISTGKVLLSINGTVSMFSKLQKYDTFILLEETKKLNKKIVEELLAQGLDKNAIGYISAEEKSVISRVTYAAPVALAEVKGFSSYAQNYFDSESSNGTKAGRHLDEYGQNWVKYLPEIYGVDAEEYYYEDESLRIKHVYDLETVDDEQMSNDQEMYYRIQKAIDICKKYGLIVYDYNVDSYYLINDIETKDDYESFRKVLQEQYKKDKNVAVRECLSIAKNNYHKTDYVEIKLFNHGGNSFVNANQRVEVDEEGRISLLARIIRSRMDFISGLFKAEEFLKNSVFADIIHAETENVNNADKYEEYIDLFANMLMCNMIYFDNDLLDWKYRLDNKSTKYIDLCKLGLPKNKLDNTSKIYLAFTKGFWEINDVKKIKYIKDNVSKYIENQDYEIRTDFMDLINNSLENELLSELYIDSEETSVIVKNLYDKSSYKSNYNIPHRVEDGDTVINNIKNFYQELYSRLDKTK